MLGLSTAQVEKIRAEYDGQTPTINRLQAEFRVERWRICSTARLIGLSKKKAFWKSEDLEYFQEKYGEVSEQHLMRKLNRSRVALLLKARRLGINRTYNAGHYTATLLARMLGIDSHKVLDQWIPRGLKAHRCAANRPIWHVTVDDLKEFLLTWPEAYDYRNADEDARMALEFDELPDPPKEKLVECCARHWPGPQDHQERNRAIRAGYRRGMGQELANKYGLTTARINQIVHGRAGRNNWVPCAQRATRFWVPLYEQHPRCPRCGRQAGMYALERRG